MHLSLIGMSGVGKSSWSRSLEAAGFRRRDCGAEIANELGVGDDVGTWLGQPYDPGFEEREARFLAAEARVLDRVLEELGEMRDDRVVIDTTGSVLYLDGALTDRLRAKTTVIHLASSRESRGRMFAGYLASMRPVVWRGGFRTRPGETEEAALRRCYPLLLDSREEQYRALADATFEEEQHRDPSWDADAFVARARALGA